VRCTMADIIRFPPGSQDVWEDWIAEDENDRKLIPFSFSRYELRVLACAIDEAIDKLGRQSALVDARFLRELTKARAALTAVLGRCMDRL
jgi:hypothetical protein